MAESIPNETDVEAAAPAVPAARAAIDTTWSVLSFVLSSEAEWPGYDAEEA